MGLGLYNVENPMKKAMEGQSGALQNLSKMQQQTTTTTSAQKGIGDRLAGAGSMAASGMAVGGVPGAVVGGVLGFFM